MRDIEEENCLVSLCHCWITLHNAKAPVNCYETMIQSINEVSEKYGYSIKTFNLLAIILTIQGEVEKAT